MQSSSSSQIVRIMVSPAFNRGSSGFPRSGHVRAGLLALPLAGILSTAVVADTPPGWINGDFISAYTQDARSVDITAEAIKINDTLDFLDIREDLIAGNRRLSEDSGDLDGFHGTIHAGIFESLSVFYTRQEQDLILKIGPVNSINVIDIDEKLETSVEEAGLKWAIYKADFLESGHAATAATLELSRLRNKSKDFDLTFDRIQMGSGNNTTTVTFTEDQVAGINNMKDDGWRARFIYTTPLSADVIGSAWVGYSRHEASSATGSTIPLDSVRTALTQTFDLEETHYRLGGSLNWQITPRLPFQLSYEYVDISKQSLVSNIGTQTPSFPLPSFLRSSNLSEEDSNHMLSASLSWWIHPSLSVGLTAKVFSNQFLGAIPHYNNPLSANFADAPYGYVGLRLGARLP